MSELESVRSEPVSNSALAADWWNDDVVGGSAVSVSDADGLILPDDVARAADEEDVDGAFGC